MADYVIDPSNGGLILTGALVEGALQAAPFIAGTVDVSPVLEGVISEWESIDVAAEVTSTMDVTFVAEVLVFSEFVQKFSITQPGLIDVSPAIDGALSEWDTIIDVSPVLEGAFSPTFTGTIDVSPTIDGRLDLWTDINVDVEIDGSLEKVTVITGRIDVVPDLFGNFNPTFTAVIDVAVALDGTWDFAGAYLINLYPDFLGAWNLVVKLDDIVLAPVVEGNWVIQRLKQVLTREDRARETEVRPSTPVWVYLLDALEQADLSVVPDNQGFLVSALYNPNDHDPYFNQRGARPNSIGEKVIVRNEAGEITNQTLVFRDPDPLEVVAYIGSLALYRFERDEAWRLYATLPQRALEGMRAFDSLDDDKIYDYYAKLLGSVYAQWSYDNYFLAQVYDPFVAPPAILPILAAQYGLKVTEDETEAQKRTKIALAIPTFKLKGLVQGIQLRLFALGYRADVFEVWVWPDNPERFANVPNDSWAAYDWSAAPGATTASVIGVAGSVVTFSGNLTSAWDPGAIIQIREPASLLGPAFQAQTVTFTGSGTEVDFGVPVGSLPSPANGVNVIPSWLAIPHGFFSGEPDFYYPTSRIIITLTDLEGNPIDAVPASFLERNPGATLNEFWEFIAADIGPDVLPVHDDIKAFGVISGDGRDGRRNEAEEIVYVTEDFTVIDLASFTETLDVVAEVDAAMPVATVWAPAPIDVSPVVEGSLPHGQTWAPAPIDIAPDILGDMPVASPGPPPTVIWYNFDETPDTNPDLIDASVGGNDSTLVGTWDRGDGALILADTGSANQGARTDAQMPGSFRDPPIAMTCWVKPYLRTDRNVMPTYAYTPYPPNVMSNDIPGLGGYGMGFNVWDAAGGYPAGSNFVIANYGNLAVPGGIIPDQWYFIAFSTGATYGTRVWVNLDIISTGAVINPSGASPAYLYTGRHNDDTNYGSRRNFWGELDEARVYDRELTVAEIEAIYLYGRSIPPIFLMTGGGFALEGGGFAVVGGP